MSVKKSVVAFGVCLVAIVQSLSVMIATTTSVAVVTTLAASSVYAAEKQKLSAKMKPLGDAKALMDKKEWKAALDKVNEVSAIPGKTAYEESLTNEMKAYCLAQLKDLPGAAKVYEAMLAANQIPADQIQAKILVISQIAFQQKDYAKSIQYGERYLKESGASTDILQQLAQAYYLKGDHKTAIDYSQKLVKQADQAKRAPDKLWLDILYNSYHKLDNKAGRLSALESLVAHYPSQDYWRIMLKHLMSENGFSEKETIEILRFKKTLGILDAEEYIEMAELSLAMTDPGDAKAALEAGIAAGVLGQPKDKERETRLLNKAKTDAAQDLATLDATAKEAESKPTGDALSKVGAAYLGHGQYDKAIVTLQNAITKGSVKAIDETYVRLGVAHFNVGKKSDAIKAFKSVSDKSKLAQLSRLWVIYAQGKK
jgi:tetratricopeptide (TPR) repeat protein